jgi:hypothetical protein
VLHDTSLFSKVGPATIAALARAVNTLLTAATMGFEKFHLTVTIDNGVALQIAGFLIFSFEEFKTREMNPRLDEKRRLWMPRHGFRPAMLLSRSAFKGGGVVGFLTADICVDAPRVVDCVSIPA